MAAGGVCPTGTDSSTTVVEATSSTTTTSGGAINISGATSGDGLDIWPWVGLGIGLCVLLLIIVVVIVVVRRRKASARDRSQSHDLETHGLTELSSTTASAFDSIMDSGGTMATAPRTNEYASVAQIHGESASSVPPPQSNYGSVVTPIQYGGADFLPESSNGGTVSSRPSVVYGQL